LKADFANVFQKEVGVVRRRVCVVGPSNAGKTSLVNNFLGKGFSEVLNSTRGAEVTFCHTGAQVNDLLWQQSPSPQSEFSAAVKELLENRNKLEEISTTDTEIILNGLQSSSDDISARSSSSSSATSLSTSTQSQVDFKELSSKISKKQIYPELEIIDYGGQRVFDDLCNIFLPSRAYYLVCFNLKWFKEESAEAWTITLFHLKYWINSIISHVMQNGLTQQIFLVGTHANSLNTMTEGARLNLLTNINKKICELFTSDTSPYISYNEEYCFFPIDNKARQGISELKASLEKSFKINESSLRIKIKLSWSHAIDVLKKTNSSILEIKQAQELLKNIIGESDVMPFLQFCEREGIFLYSKRAMSRHSVMDDAYNSSNNINNYDKIILDPVAYFIEPASLIICQHKEYAHSSPAARHHNNYFHQKCRTEYPEQWKLFVEEGILSVEMLNQILSKYSNEDRKNITNFMISTNLLIPIYSQSDNIIQKYFIPSLLLNQSAVFNPLSAPPSQLKSAAGTTDLFVTTVKCYVYVTLYPNTECYTEDQMKRNGFLPNSFFNQLIACLISSDVSENGTIDSCGNRIQGQMLKVLDETQVLLSFGNQFIRLSNHFIKNVIEIEIQGYNPSIIEKEIRRISKDLCNNSFQKKLSFQTLFSCPANIQNQGESSMQHGVIFISCDSILIDDSHSLNGSTTNINPNQGLFSDGLLFNSGSQKAFLNKNELKTSFHLWLQHDLPRSQHDYFFSYRQVSETDFVAQIFNKFQHYSLDEKKRGYHIFKDSHQLQVGNPLKESLIEHLINSVVFVPFISSGAMVRVKEYSSNTDIDHVLLEWIVAMILFKFRDKITSSNGKRVSLTSIIPVFLGVINHETQKMNDLFTESDFKCCVGMTEIVPTRELECALSSLASKQVTLPLETKEEVRQWSVGKIVSEYQNILAITPWTLKKDIQEPIYDENVSITSIISFLLKNLVEPPKPADNAIWRFINAAGSVIKANQNRRYPPLETAKLTLGSVVLAGVVIGSRLLK
jgi:GTPase SAR1 family protein